MQIDTKRLLLRKFSEQDLQDVFEYCSQSDVGEMAGWKTHASQSETAEILKEWIQKDNQLAVVLKENQKVIGHIGIGQDSEEGREDTKELGYALNCRYRRQGFMSEAVLAVMDFVFNSDVAYIWACCFQENEASKKLIEKCGFIFQQEGTFYSKSLKWEYKSYEYRLSKDEWYRMFPVQTWK